jgi:hypothetical protein
MSAKKYDESPFRRLPDRSEPDVWCVDSVSSYSLSFGPLCKASLPEGKNSYTTPEFLCGISEMMPTTVTKPIRLRLDAMSMANRQPCSSWEGSMDQNPQRQAHILRLGDLVRLRCCASSSEFGKLVSCHLFFRMTPQSDSWDDSIEQHVSYPALFRS